MSVSSASSTKRQQQVQEQPKVAASKPKPAQEAKATPKPAKQQAATKYADAKAPGKYEQDAARPGRAKQTKKAATLKNKASATPRKAVSGDGGGSKPQGASETGATQKAAAPGAGKGDVQLNVPWYSQFKGGNGFTPGDKACFDASKAMARDAGATVLGPDQRIQVGKSEDSKGRLTVDSEKAAQGRAYIDRELEAGRPVVVGVSHSDKNYNVDKLTDHFVTVTGRGTDEKGRTFYNYNEPGTSHQSKSQGRLYVDDKTGNLVADQTSMGKRYEVAMVRKNAQDTSVPNTAPTPGQNKPGSAPAPQPQPSPAGPPTSGPQPNKPKAPEKAPSGPQGPQGPAPADQAGPAQQTGAMADVVNKGGLLRRGSNGPAVQEMQQKLNDLGYKLDADGKFGPKTADALRQFQQDQGIKVDGLFGPQSLGALEKAGAANGQPLANKQDNDPANMAKAPAKTGPDAQPAPNKDLGKAPAKTGPDAQPAPNKDLGKAPANNPDAQAPAAKAGTQPPASGTNQAPKTDATAPQKPAVGGKWQDAASDIRNSLGIQGPSEKLSPQQVDQALTKAAERYGVSKELLVHTMKSESGGDQKKDNGAAHGLMQIERVHKDAYRGNPNVGNDTVSNIAYAAQRWAAIGGKMDSAFKSQGLTPPSGSTKDALMDMAYNRGDGVIDQMAKRAKQQGIDTNNLGEYFAGKGGKADYVRDRNGNYTMNITPGAGVDKHGQGSVLQETVENLRDGHFKQSAKYKDRSGDGVRDHYDIWIQRSGKLLEAQRKAAS